MTDQVHLNSKPLFKADGTPLKVGDVKQGRYVRVRLCENGLTYESHDRADFDDNPPRWVHTPVSRWREWMEWLKECWESRP